MDLKQAKDFFEVEKKKVPVLSSVLTIDVDAVEKVSSELVEDVKEGVVRAVQEVTSQKTFLSCLPFLSKFWVSRKQE
jgi:hypothetical protein